VVRLTHALAIGEVAGVVVNDPIRREVTGSGVVPVVLVALLVVLILVVLLLVALRTRGRLRRRVAVLLLPVSAAWVAFNGRLEGPVLLSLTSAHGITASDVLAILGVVIALSVLVLDRRPRGRPGPRRAAQRVDSRDH
jgi:hypothetical protein